LPLSRLPRAPDPQAVELARLLSYSAAELYKAGIGAETQNALVFEEALKYFDAATVKNPKLVDAWLKAAAMCHWRNDSMGEIVRLQHALRLEVSGPTCLKLANAFTILGGHSDNALDCYELARMICVRKAEKLEEAVRTARSDGASKRATDSRIDNVRCLRWALIGEAGCEATRRHYENVIRALKSAEKLGEDTDMPLCVIYFREGLAYEKLGRHADAEATFVKGRNWFGKDEEPSAWSQLAWEWQGCSTLGNGFDFGDIRWQREADAFSRSIESAINRGKKPRPIDVVTLIKDGCKANDWPVVFATYQRAIPYIEKDEAKNALSLIAAYGVRQGKVRVHGALTIYIDCKGVAKNRVSLFIDQNRVDVNDSGVSSDGGVSLQSDLKSVTLKLEQQELPDGIHRLDIMVYNDQKAVAKSTATISVDNAHPNDIFNMKDFNVNLSDTTTILPH
jgi:tetratricopeptide (TPR) repeat protein